jgi:ATP-dependent DNA helicase RecG
VLDDSAVIEQAREAAERLLAADPDLEHAAALRSALDRLADSDASDYLDKA